MTGAEAAKVGVSGGWGRQANRRFASGVGGHEKVDATDHGS